MLLAIKSVIASDKPNTIVVPKIRPVTHSSISQIEPALTPREDRSHYGHRPLVGDGVPVEQVEEREAQREHRDRMRHLIVEHDPPVEAEHEPEGVQ